MNKLLVVDLLVAAVALLAGCVDRSVPAVTQTEVDTLVRPNDTVLFRATAVDPGTLPLRYQFAWGDSTPIESTVAYASGVEVIRQHVYADTGRYSVRVRARNDLDKASAWSDPLEVRAALLAPSTPLELYGPAACTVLTHVTFGAVATSPYGDYVEYEFDWGDGQSSGWVGARVSGETCYAHHEYIVGDTTVMVRSRARDKSGLSSDWSSPKSVRVEPVAYAYRVVDTIEIGATIDDMTLLPNTTTAYAISGTFGRLLVFDTQTGSVRTAAEFLGGPTGICALRNGAFVYVSCSNTSDVLAVRTFDDTIVARVRVSIPDDGGVAAAIDDSKVYAASLGARICVIRTVDNLVVDSIYPGHPPRRLAVSPDGQHLYVSTGTNNVLAIRLSDYSVVATVPVGEDPVGMAVSPDGKRVYVANRNSNSVSVIRTEDNVVEATITSVGRWVDYLSLSPDGRYLYASGESLWVIRTSDFSLVPLAVEFGYTAASLVTPDGCVYVYGRIPSGHDAIYKLGF